MGRHDDYGDEYDQPGKPPRGGLPPVALVVAGAAALGVVVVAAALFLAAGRQGAQPAQPPAGGGESAAVKPTRDEFKAKVMGKTPDEVIAAVGRPSATHTTAAGAPYWFYDEPTRDPVTGKTDRQATVWFNGGRVSSVDY